MDRGGVWQGLGSKSGISRDLRTGKVKESDGSALRAERARERRGGAVVQIPCKHLQWICELFKRLNSLKNLVYTGAVCHRRHPPFATLRHSLYRTSAVLPYPKLRATVLFLSLSLSLSFSLSPSPSLFTDSRLCHSICQFLSLGSLTLCISNNWYSSQCKETDGAPLPRRSPPRRPDVEQIIRAENLRKSPPRINPTAHFYQAYQASFAFRTMLHSLSLSSRATLTSVSLYPPSNKHFNPSFDRHTFALSTWLTQVTFNGWNLHFANLLRFSIITQLSSC